MAFSRLLLRLGGALTMFRPAVDEEEEEDVSPDWLEADAGRSGGPINDGGVITGNGRRLDQNR